MFGNSRMIVALIMASSLMLGVAPMQTGATTAMENPASGDGATLNLGPDQGGCETQSCVCGFLMGPGGDASLVCGDAGGSSGAGGGFGPFQL